MSESNGINMEEILTEMEKEKLSCTTKGMQNKDVVITKLKELGIKEVFVKYSGSGDSGDFEQPSLSEDHFYYKDGEYEQTIFYNEKVTIKKTKSHFVDGKWEENTTEMEVELGDAITDMTYFLLEGSHPGWEINDGSDGVFRIDVEEEKIYLSHNENEMISHNYEAEF